jgi:hypothetical protein
VQFEFYRLRFHFQAIDSLWFAPGEAANAVRGAFGYALRAVACRCGARTHDAGCAYARIFEPRPPGRTGPSGFAERPRPFVFRTSRLSGAFLAQSPFSFDLHLFDLYDPPLEYLVEAMALMAERGLARRQAKLISVEQFDANDGRLGRVWDGKKTAPLLEPVPVSLEANGGTAACLRVRFLTPTELKSGGEPAAQPDFPVLFARIRNRLSLLRALYGPGPLDIDFRGAGERAANIQMTRCVIQTEYASRRSSRTGQLHSLGGFTGEAEYSGDVAEFLPFLRAARWTGVGRQTVWGKGEIEVVE